MSSQTDLDQGGTSRVWVKTYLGPSIGWVEAPGGNPFLITAAGTYAINLSTTLVEVNVAGAVIINLPSAVNPAAGAGAIPRPFVGPPIVVVDVGGFAQANPITINPAAGETIMGLLSLQITTNYGGYTLLPNSPQRTWNSISP